jgi:AAA domain/DnaB-like helicase N terminal domain
MRSLHFTPTASRPTPVTVADELRLAGLLEDIGGPATLVSLQVNCPATAHADRYAEIVQDRAQLRRLIAVANEMEASAYGSTATPADIVGYGSAALADIDATRFRTDGPNGELPAPVDWATLWASDDPTVAEWLVEPLIPVGRQIAIYPAAKAGKSLLTLEIATALATGRAVLDRRPGPGAIEVAYIDQEMTEDDLRDRLADLGYGADSDLSHLHYYQLVDLPPLDTPAGGAAVEAIVTRDAAQALVLDTMARVVKGAENDADTYRDFYRHCGRRLKGMAVTLIRLDHSGHDPTHQRGSSGKVDDVDLVWRLTAEGSRVIMRRTHSRIPWVAETVTLERREEPLRHTVAPVDSWPSGTAELAAALDRYDVPLDATVKTAQTALRTNRDGRRTGLVTAALRWRRQRP